MTATAGGRAKSQGRARGDEARDRHDWPLAVAEYRSYLTAVPYDAPIWVQLGHALKETGAFADAEAAYRAALALTPDDADLLLQIGHLMKLRGRVREAVRYYEASVAKDPASPAYRELIALGRADRADASLLAAHSASHISRTYFQIDDVLSYLSSHKTVSGIQRVQIAVMHDVLSQAPGAKDPRNAFVFTEPYSTRIWEASGADLRALISYLDESEVDHPKLAGMIRDLKSNAMPARPQAGSTFIMIGAFWAAVNNTNVLAMLRERGVSLGVYFHDCIPVEFPELCDPNLVNYYTQFLAETLSMLDFAVSVSEFTASEVRRFIRREGFTEIPISAVPLAHSLSTSRDAQDATEEYVPTWSAATLPLRGSKFVLYVSTIEARKNHKYLFNVWKQLLAEGIDPPTLVFVGRYGWRVNEFIEQLKSTDYLDGRIRIFHDLSDRELETLYRECYFTVFTSLVEGWGLPVGESLAYGKLCVSSNAASMPEVGGDFVIYVDPLNIREGIETFRRILNDPAVVAEREAQIRQRFIPRTWSEVTRDLLTAIHNLSAQHPGIEGNRFVPMIEPGELIMLGDFSLSADPFSERLPRHPKQRVKRMLLATSWHVPEPCGVWLDGVEGSIRFATRAAPGENIVVFLRLTSTPYATANTLTICHESGIEISRDVPTGSAFNLRLVFPVDAKAEAYLTLAVGGDVLPIGGDPRKICVGLVSVTYVAEKDAAGRAEILERELFDRRRKLLKAEEA